ncbi:PREDICTED: nucleoporin p54-like [Priapulus caudatus]|uniref:Nucleoporin p54-like n=1 Tax=Priapulus caudatus TaxID=37621 RepID=A0ABM1F8L7_PRICU|nr:PREDICTED: nucleoporin p54-like [Priapulus caudatus]
MSNQQVYTSDNLAALATALSLPTVYGDERDTLLAKWNQLQAFWGSGKGYYAPNAAPVTFAPDNIFCRFKAIGFSRIPEGRNEEGLCMLIINKKDTEVIQQQQQLVDSLYRLLGSKPTLSVCVEGVKPIPDNKCEVVMYVLERAATGASRRVPAMDLFSFLNTVRTQLVGMGIDTVIPKLAPTKEQLAEYLKNPPAGIDPLIWQQAKLDNPNPGLLIPVPMIGFTELYRRLKFQEQETKLHQGRLDVMIRQEVARKQGYAIQVDEEQLRDQLEAIQNELNAPTQFKGRLNELMSQIRMQNEMSGMRWEDKYSIDEHLLQEIKQHLKKQHDGISHLISVIKDDMEDLSIIQQGLQITQPSYRR